ncbi:MAG: hypothetical protein LBH16_09785 [Treponema sp.]|jgi:archaellum biogenesis ATPase FlaH|nr:hypothetical protein [Treponema sp.]
MVLKELISRSPIRIFEQSIHGGLKAGEIGIIASPNGVGKTSVLVQIALDKLLQEKKVIHVSFTQYTQSAWTPHVLIWYEDIFNELINKKNLENAAEIKNDLVKNRVLMNFNQDGMSKDKILKSLRAMIVDGGFNADSIIIDGFDFSRVSEEIISGVKSFAAELGVSIWYSCSVNDTQYDRENIPAVISGFSQFIDVVIVLQPRPNHVDLSVSKDRDSRDSKSMAMRLDPKTLLILGN